MCMRLCMQQTLTFVDGMVTLYHKSFVVYFDNNVSMIQDAYDFSDKLARRHVREIGQKAKYPCESKEPQVGNNMTKTQAKYIIYKSKNMRKNKFIQALTNK